jgi:hypothetical protein
MHLRSFSIQLYHFQFGGKLIINYKLRITKIDNL